MSIQSNNQLNSNNLVNVNSATQQNGAFFSERQKDQAYKTFWALKDRFWMQTIDGKYHEHGPMVFDKALHGRKAEPGFYLSLKRGCEFASAHLGERLTISFYKALHKELCAHFKGRQNNTEMAANETGIFRDASVECKMSIKNHTNEARNHYSIVELYNKYYSGIDYTDEEWKLFLDDYFKTCLRQDKSYLTEKWVKETQAYWKNQTDINEKIADAYLTSKKWVDQSEAKWDEKIAHINKFISQLLGILRVNRFVSISRQNQIIQVDYLCCNPKEHEKIVQALFDRYNSEIDQINKRLKNSSSNDDVQSLLNEKVDAVAHLYQMLEWLHPFIDGQGRTDLVLKDKLLCEEGLNPAILDEPYTSTYSTLSNWTSDLKIGMERWKKEANKS